MKVMADARGKFAHDCSENALKKRAILCQQFSVKLDGLNIAGFTVEFRLI